jgi:hypothetical protein
VFANRSLVAWPRAWLTTHVQVAFAYFRVFFATMRREWFGIDRLRLDKFLMLVRKFVQQTFVHLRNTDWCAAAAATWPMPSL